MVIRPPPAWGREVITRALRPYEPLRPAEYRADARRVRVVPDVRRIGLIDLKVALVEGFRDLDTARTDVVLLRVMYPIIGLVVAMPLPGHAIWHLYGAAVPH